MLDPQALKHTIFKDMADNNHLLFWQKPLLTMTELRASAVLYQACLLAGCVGNWENPRISLTESESLAALDCVILDHTNLSWATCTDFAH